MRVVLVLATLLVVSLAGCVSDDEPEPAGSSSPSSPSAPSSPSGQSDAAPDPAASGGASTTTAGAGNETKPAPEVKPELPYKQEFTESGAAASGVWVCEDENGVGECTGHEIEPANPVITVDYADRLIALEVMLSWERLLSSSRYLVAEVIATPADGGEPVTLAVEADTSPVFVELPELDVDAGTLSISVRPRSNTGSGSTYVFFSPENQEFELTGTLTLKPSG